MKRSSAILILLFLILADAGVFGQIRGGSWISSKSYGNGVVCNDDAIDFGVYCTAAVLCTQPPNPIDGFFIGADADASCPNQPVDNLALTSGAVGGLQAVASSKSTAIFYNRLIRAISRTGDCNGHTAVVQNFSDPQGCNPPPPPPPPPPCTGCGSCAGCRPPGCSSPIVVDLLDEGMHFTSLTNGVPFDFNGDDKPLFMSWTDPSYHNAWLALDRNGNGTIDNAQELFGYVTEPQSPSSDGRRNGWLALAVYDDPSRGGNGDGMIDANDSIYPALVLWLDENHDGISQAGELHHLAEMRVQSIRLKYKDKSYSDENGNTFQFQSFVSVGTGDEGKHRQEKRQAWDVVLDASETPPGTPEPHVFCGPTKN